jgi:ribosome-binding protein aMBF1 (putative translation factor)
LAAKVRTQDPQISQAELARQLGVSATRLRQIDRAEVHPELPRPVDRSDPVLRGEVSP